MGRYKKQRPRPLDEASIEEMVTVVLAAMETGIAENGGRPSIQVINRSVAAMLLASTIREVSILALENKGN